MDRDDFAVAVYDALNLDNDDDHDEEALKMIASMVADLKAGKNFFANEVMKLRKEAMDVSLKYEPCGYYCDPDEDGGGHHDHKLFNHAKYLFGDGVKSYLPISLDPERW